MRRKSWTRIAVLTLWLTTMAAVQLWIWRRDCTPGAPALPTSAWPVDSVLSRAADGFTIVMCVDANCPCSAASLRELNRLLTPLPPDLKPRVHLIVAEAGTDNALGVIAQPLDGINIYVDHSGEEMGRFHAMTSGQLFVYDRGGRLRFSGGLTIARGHEGRSLAYEYLDLLLRTGTPQSADSVLRTQVFGCAIEPSKESTAIASRP